MKTILEPSELLEGDILKNTYSTDQSFKVIAIGKTMFIVCDTKNEDIELILDEKDLFDYFKQPITETK